MGTLSTGNYITNVSNIQAIIQPIAEPFNNGSKVRDILISIFNKALKDIGYTIRYTFKLPIKCVSLALTGF